MDPELLTLDRLPLPSLKVYTYLSVLAASFSFYYIGTESGSALKQLSLQTHQNGYCAKFNITRPTNYEELLLERGSGGNSVIVESDSEIKTASSLGGLVAASYYWWHDDKNDNFNDPSHLNDHHPHHDDQQTKNVTESDCINERNQQLTWQLFQWATQQPHCVWPLVNLVYCLLILASHAVQQAVFGSLRSSEQENIKDQFWNLVFYKVVFVFGVVDVQEVEDAVGWCFFVSVIGFLQLARQLCQERHNYLILINDTTKASEAKRRSIIRLLTFIFTTSIFLFVAVVLWFLNSSPKDFSHAFLDLKDIIPPKPLNDLLSAPAAMANAATSGGATSSGGYDFNLGLHSAIFMLSEIGLLILQALHALTMCFFDQLYFQHKLAYKKCCSLLTLFSGSKSEDDKAIKDDNNDEEDLYLCASQDINYKFEIISLMFDLIHHVHMFVCSNLFLSMTSLIVALQMRLRVKQIHVVLKRRYSFTSLNEHIDRYCDVQSEDKPCENGEDTSDDMSSCDNCAICWEPISSQKSKILPCKHNFHKTCLRKWLLVSMHCPTCRLSLLSEQETKLRRENEPRRRFYGPRPAYGIMGLLQTGQTLLDLFGGWDPLPDDYPAEVQNPTASSDSVPDNEEVDEQPSSSSSSSSPSSSSSSTNIEPFTSTPANTTGCQVDGQ